MAQKVHIINSTNGAEYNDNELQFIPSLTYTAGIFADKDSGVLGLGVTAQDTPDMSVKAAAGVAYIEVTIASRNFKAVLENTADQTVAIAANSTGSDRVDAVICRIDVDTEPDALKTNVGTIEVVLGNAVTALSDAEITTALGNDGWVRLADITVPDAAASIDNSAVGDERVKVGFTSAVDISDPVNPSITNRDVTTGLIDQEHTGSGSSIAVGEADSAGNNNKISQSFIPLDDGIKGVRLFKKPDTGTFTGDVTVSLQADAGGAPSGVPLASHVIASADWVGIVDDSEFEVNFTSQYNGFQTSNIYWIVVTCSTSDNANHPNLAGAGGNAYTDGEAFTQNTTDGWSAISNTDLYFRTLQLTENQVVKTGVDGKIKGVLSGTVRVYEADDSWVKPLGLSYVIVEVVGAGGSGGQQNDVNDPSIASGGASGGYSRKLFRAEDLKSVEEIIVGATTAQNSGLQAGTSSFATISCTGGFSATSQSLAIGGVATGGDVNIDGQRGGRGITNGNGGVTGGEGGSNPLGSGGAIMSSDSNATGNAGTGYGSGGAGGGDGSSSTRQGGVGRGGVVIITEF